MYTMYSYFVLTNHFSQANDRIKASSLQSNISSISVTFARWKHHCGRSLLSTIVLLHVVTCSLHVLTFFRSCDGSFNVVVDDVVVVVRPVFVIIVGRPRGRGGHSRPTIESQHRRQRLRVILRRPAVWGHVVRRDRRHRGEVLAATARSDPRPQHRRPGLVSVGRHRRKHGRRQRLLAVQRLRLRQLGFHK